MVRPPIVSRPDTFPLNDLEWDRFESFCTNFISHLPGVKRWTAHRYGQQGDQQKGIDIIVEMENGERWVFQCKKYKSFKANQVRAAIQKCTYQADKFFLALSCQASAPVRDEIQKYQNWELWDVEDISRIIRELSSEVACQIVEHHFGKVWRKEFLGLAGLTSFVTVPLFFDRWLRTDKPFNHAWEMIGRRAILTELDAFVDSKDQIAILSGRGGIGKTRLLYEFSKTFETHYSGWAIRFWMDGAPINPESLDELPVTSTVVVIDNADRCDDLPILLTFAQQHPQNLKFIFTVRPGGFERLKSSITKKGIDLTCLEELKALDRSEVKALARQALGDEYSCWVDHLTAVTRDCPLVTLVGGWLLREKSIDPALLERNQDFQDEVLKRLEENILEAIANEATRERCRELLELISAISPVYPNNLQFQEVASTFLKTTKSKLLQDLESLEESGILVRRGKSLRIAPDVLSEHILATACLTKQGLPKGYVQDIFDSFGKLCLKSIVRNFAELDWRIGVTRDQEVDLLKEIWQVIWDEFQSAPNSGRCRLLDLVAEMAIYQPKQALALVEFAIQNPATVIEQEGGATFYTHQEVLCKLPSLLHMISYTLEHLLQCCDLLWELVKQTGSETSSSRQTASQALIDLAEYDVYPRKTPECNELVIEAVERWLKAPDAFDYQCSPLDVLDPVLARTFESSRTEGLTVTMQEFYVNPKATQVVRDKALQIVSQCITSEQLKVILRSLKSLNKALTNPDNRLSQRADNQCEQWIPEQLRILDLISQLIKRTTEPLIHLEVLQAMHQHIHHAYSDAVRQKMQSIIDSIAINDQLKLVGALMYSNDLAWLIEPVEQVKSASEKTVELFESKWQREQNLSKDICKTAVSQFFKTFSDPYEAVNSIYAQLDIAVTTGLQPDFSNFIELFGDLAEPTYLAQTCEAVIQAPTYLAPYLGLLLCKLRKQDLESAIALAQTAVNTGDPNLCAAVAQGFWNSVNNLLPSDINLIQRLAQSEHLGVKRLLFNTLRLISEAEPELGINIALAMETGESSELADSLCRIFVSNNGVSLDFSTLEQVEIILNKLEYIADLDQYNICKFLSYACRRSARATVDLFLKRLRHYIKQDKGVFPFPRLGFRHNPHGGAVLSGLQDSPDYQEILSEIRDLMLTEKMAATSYLSNLFRLVSLDFNSVSLEILNEWINSGDSMKVEAAGQLLQDAPSSFVLKNEEFVANLLEQASSIGFECLERTRNSLFHTVVFRSLSRTIGQPSPAVVDEYEQATKISSKYPIGSLVCNFYEEIAEQAHKTIQGQVEMDEELLD